MTVTLKVTVTDWLSPVDLSSLKRTFSDYGPKLHQLEAEAHQLERRLSDLVNQAYGLSPEEIDLLWRTAPPRMPAGQ